MRLRASSIVRLKCSLRHTETNTPSKENRKTSRRHMLCQESLLPITATVLGDALDRCSESILCFIIFVLLIPADTVC